MLATEPFQPFGIIENQDWLKAAWDAAGDAMAISDPEGIVLAANPYYYQLYGLTPDQVLGRGFASIFPPEYQSAAREDYKRIFGTNEVLPVVRSTVRRSDGMLRSVEVRYAFLMQEGKRAAMLSIIRDTTEREEAARNKDEFISLASHELRTPMTSLKGFAQVLSRSLNRREATATELRAVQVIEAQAERLTRLINDLLDVSRLETGKLRMRQEEFDLGAEVAEVVEVARLINTEHLITLELDHDTTAPRHAETMYRVLGDRDRIDQVLTNLLDNAVQHSPAGTTIRLAVRSRSKIDGSETTDEHDRITGIPDDPDKSPQATATSPYRWIVVSVDDQGSGIAKEQQSRIFERYFQVDKATAKGLGLGLYLAKQIIESHNGRIWLESEVGKGSRFTFALPAA